RRPDEMAFAASDEHRQGRAIKNGACRLAEKIAGAIYVQLDTGADFTGILAGCRPMNQRKTIRIGVIADTHGLFDPVVRQDFKDVDHIVHAGDIGDWSVIEQLEQIAPVTAVSGNVDAYEQCKFPSKATTELTAR